MSTLAVTNTFVPGAVITAAGHNQNFSDIVAWANGNIGNTNFGTLTGVVTWSVTTNVNAISITNAGTEGSLSIAHNATLASSKSAVKITSNAAQSAGTALLEITASSVSNAIPALKITDAGAGSPAFTVVSTTKSSHPVPSMTTTQRNALTSPAAGDQIYNTTNSKVEVYDGSSWNNPLNIVTKTTTYSATDADDVILADTSGGAWTLTLPAASGGKRRLKIKLTASTTNRLTVSRAGSDTIDGLTSIKMGKQYDCLELISDGTSLWNISIFDVAVGYSATSTSGDGIASGVDTILGFTTTVLFDYQSAYAIDTYTAPIKGTYAIHAHVATASTAYSAGNAMRVAIYINGSQIAVGDIVIPTGTFSARSQATLMTQLVAGDTVDIRVNPPASSNRSTNAIDNRFSIVRIS